MVRNLPEPLPIVLSSHITKPTLDLLDSAQPLLSPDGQGARLPPQLFRSRAVSVKPPGLIDVRGVRSGHSPRLGRTPRLLSQRSINPQWAVLLKIK